METTDFETAMRRVFPALFRDEHKQASIYNENGLIDITARRNEIAERMKADNVAEEIWNARMEA